MSEPRATHCYFTRCHVCGQPNAVAVDVPGDERSTGRWVGKQIRRGYTVENSTIEEFKAGEFCVGCEEATP